MFANFDFDVIRRSLGYLFFDGMTFTLMLTALAARRRPGVRHADRADAAVGLPGCSARIAGLYVDLIARCRWCW